jgi:hypothetical protein
MESIYPVLWEKQQRDLIIEHAQALFGANHQRQSHTWGVIMSKTSDARYKAHVIVYEGYDSFKKWITLRSGAKASDVKAAMAALLEGLREDIGQKCFRLVAFVRDVFAGC